MITQYNLYLAETAILADRVADLIAGNMDEFPDIPYNDLYLTCETLIKLKWKAIEIVNGEKKK